MQPKKGMCKTMKKIAIYMYDTAPIFEISIAAYLLNTQYEVCVVTDKLPDIKTSEGVFIKSNLYLNEINVDEFEGLIICGGEYSKYNNNSIFEYVYDNIIFSSPNKYAMFGITVGNHFKIYKDKDDYNETVDFFASK